MNTSEGVKSCPPVESFNQQLIRHVAKKESIDPEPTRSNSIPRVKTGPRSRALSDPDTRGRLAPEGGDSSIKLCFGLNEVVIRLRAVKEPRRSRGHGAEVLL